VRAPRAAVVLLLVGRPVAGADRRLGLVVATAGAVAVALGRVADGRGRGVLEEDVDAALVVAREDRVDELVDDLARGPAARRLHPQPPGIRAAGERAQHVEVELGQRVAREQVGVVDRAAHRRAVAQVDVLARRARDVDGEWVQAGARRAASAADDLELLVARLVVELDDEEAVGQPAREARGPDVVEGVRRADDGEAGRRLDAAEPRDLDVAVRQRSEQRVERAARRPVELLDVEDAAGAHRANERTGDEVLGAVAVLEHHRRVERADERVSGELLVAGRVDEAVGAVAELGGERADDRRLRHARQPEQEDRLAVGQRTRQQPQLVAAPDHLAADR